MHDDTRRKGSVRAFGLDAARTPLGDSVSLNMLTLARLELPPHARHVTASMGASRRLKEEPMSTGPGAAQSAPRSDFKRLSRDETVKRVFSRTPVGIEPTKHPVASR